MNPFMMFLLQMLSRAGQQQQARNPYQAMSQYPQYRQGYLRSGQPLNGQGRFGPMAGAEGTPQAQAARAWLWRNFFGTPGGGVLGQTPGAGGQYENYYGVNADVNGRPIAGARGMEGGGPRDTAAEQRNWMDSLFSGEGRTPGGAGGGGGGFPFLV